MLSKKQIKYYRSLSLNQYRKKYGRFLVAGEKACQDLLISNGMGIVSLLSTNEWQVENQNLVKRTPLIITAKENDLKRISSMKSSPKIILEIEIPNYVTIDKLSDKGLYFYLDGIQDPGNMGTIIRTCTWFGFKYLVLSDNCVNPYSPKVVQSSMATIEHVQFIESNLQEIKQQFPNWKLVGADMNGQPLKSLKNQTHPNLIVIGQEGHGISEHVMNDLDELIAISRITDQKVDSLNAAIALSILAYHYTLT